MGKKTSSQRGKQSGQYENLTVSEEAVRQVSERYISRLKSIIRSKLNERIRRKEGTSDIAQAVFKSFFESNVDLTESDDLLSVLLTFTFRKIKNIVRKYKAKKRDYRREQTELKVNDLGISISDIEMMASGPSAEEAVIVMDEIERLVECLQERQQQMVALLSKGYSKKETAIQLGCSERTVRRDIKDIRKRWEDSSDV